MRAVRYLLAALAMSAAVAAGVAAFRTTAKGQAAPAQSRWNAQYFTNTELITHEGKRVRLYDDLLRNKIFLVNFVFTSCSQLCPLTTARLLEVQQRLGNRVGKDIFFYSVSLDPLNDTPEKLKAFAEGFGIGPGWLFLTGDLASVAIAREKLGDRSRDKAEHQAVVYMSNNKTGEWLKDSAMSDPQQLADAILNLDPEVREKTQSVAANVKNGAPVAVKNVRGHALFARACSTCHTIGSGDKIGPDLAGVTARRDRAWLTRFITNPDKLRAEGDPIAKELLGKYKGVLMPYLGLNETDVEDALAYIESMTSQRSASGEGGTVKR